MSRLCLPLLISLEFTLVQWFSTMGDFVSKHSFGNIWRHFLIVTTWELLLVSRDVAKQPTMHRKAPITKDYPVQNVNHAEVENPLLQSKPASSHPWIITAAFELVFLYLVLKQYRSNSSTRHSFS